MSGAVLGHSLLLLGGEANRQGWVTSIRSLIRPQLQLSARLILFCRGKCFESAESHFPFDLECCFSMLVFCGACQKFKVLYWQ